MTNAPDLWILATYGSAMTAAACYMCGLPFVIVTGGRIVMGFVAGEDLGARLCAGCAAKGELVDVPNGPAVDAVMAELQPAARAWFREVC